MCELLIKKTNKQKNTHFISLTVLFIMTLTSSCCAKNANPSVGHIWAYCISCYISLNAGYILKCTALCGKTVTTYVKVLTTKENALTKRAGTSFQRHEGRYSNDSSQESRLNNIFLRFNHDKKKARQTKLWLKPNFRGRGTQVHSNLFNYNVQNHMKRPKNNN